MGGSYWRRSAVAQVGMRQGDTSFYVGADALNDNGWRDRSPSKLRRIYADVGVLGDRSEFHVNFTGASNFFGAAAATPIEMLNQRWSAVYTTPQTYKNQLAFLNSTGSYQATDTLSFKGNIYYRGFWQKHVDGNTSDVVPCDPGLFPGTLCFEENDDPLFGLNGLPVPDTLNGLTPGSIDRTATAANSYGASGQAASSAKLFGLNNQFVVGASVDRGRVNFQAASELGTIGPDLFVTGTGVIVNQPDGSVAPANLKTSNTYYGFYLTDTHRPDVAAVGHRRRPLQPGADQARGPARRRAQRRAPVQPVQSGHRRHLQDHAAARRLCGLFRGQPRADAGRARLRRSGAALPARQFPGLRSAAQAGGRPHLRGGPARQHRCRSEARPHRLESRRVPHQLRGRHHSCRQPDHRARLLPECRHHTPLGHRGRGLVPIRSLERLCQLQLSRRHLPGHVHAAVSRQSVRRGWAHHGHARQRHAVDPGAPGQGRSRIRGVRQLEGRRRFHRRERPISARG